MPAYSKKTAESYDKDLLTILGAIVERRKRKQLLQKHKITLKNKNIYIVGCGTGRDAEEIKQDFNPAEIDASDPSKYMISLAKNKHPYINFSAKSAENLKGVASEYYDFVNCSLILNQVRNYKKAIKEMFRICKTGGHILITIVHPHSIGENEEKKRHKYTIEAFNATAWKRPASDYKKSIFESSGKIIDEESLITSAKDLDMTKKDLKHQFYIHASYEKENKKKQKEIEKVFNKHYSDINNFAWGWMILSQKT